MGLILALDQGSTKTAALVATERGDILGAGSARGACHASDGMEAAMRAVQEAALAALKSAGITAGHLHGPLRPPAAGHPSAPWSPSVPGHPPVPSPTPAPGSTSASQPLPLPAVIDQVCAGMTGADWPHEYPLLQENLRRATGVAWVTVVNDCIAARRAGSDRPWGSVVCAGTGLNVAVTSPGGETYIYGYYIQGDDQGGTALGTLALRAVFAAEAGIGPPTRLTGALLRHYGAAAVDELLQRRVAGRLGPSSELVPLLAAAARAGDEVALAIVHGFAGRAARYVTARLERFGMTDLEQDVVLTGGVFKAGLPGLREGVAAAIARVVPRARLVDAPYEPVVGALVLALEERHGVPFALSDPVLAGSARRHGLIRRWSE